jgi:hypothetical protein
MGSRACDGQAGSYAPGRTLNTAGRKSPCRKSRLPAIGADDERLGNNSTDGNLMSPDQVTEVVSQSMGRNL